MARKALLRSGFDYQQKLHAYEAYETNKGSIRYSDVLRTFTDREL